MGGGRSRAEHIAHAGARQPTSTEYFANIFRALEWRAFSQQERMLLSTFVSS
jgi:hypothetical protein